LYSSGFDTVLSPGFPEQADAWRLRPHPQGQTTRE